MTSLTGLELYDVYDSPPIFRAVASEQLPKNHMDMDMCTLKSAWKAAQQLRNADGWK